MHGMLLKCSALRTQVCHETQACQHLASFRYIQLLCISNLCIHTRCNKCTTSEHSTTHNTWTQCLDMTNGLLQTLHTLKGQDHLQKVARLPVHLHPQKGQLVVGGGVKGLIVAGVHLLSAVASHELAPKAHRHLLQLHLLCTHTSYQQTLFCTHTPCVRNCALMMSSF